MILIVAFFIALSSHPSFVQQYDPDLFYSMLFQLSFLMLGHILFPCILSNPYFPHSFIFPLFLLDMLPKQDQRLRDAVRKYFPVHVDKSVTSSSSSSSSSSRSSEQIQRIEPDSASESTPTDTALPLSKTADIEVSSFSRFPPKVYRDLNGHALPPPVEEIVIVTM